MADKSTADGRTSGMPIEVKQIALLLSTALAFFGFTTGVGTEDGVGLSGTLVVKPGTSQEEIRQTQNFFRLVGLGSACIALLCLGWLARGWAGQPPLPAAVRRLFRQVMHLLGLILLAAGFIGDIIYAQIVGSDSPAFRSYFGYSLAACMVGTTLILLVLPLRGEAVGSARGRDAGPAPVSPLEQAFPLRSGAGLMLLFFAALAALGSAPLGVGSILAYTFFAALVSLHGRQWYKTIRAYGRVPIAVIGQMLSFAWKTPKGLILLVTAVAAALFAFNYLVRDVPYPIPLVVYALCVTFNNVSWNCVPPTVLFLTTSSWENAWYMMRLKGAVFPLRIVALLDPERVAPFLSTLFSMDNLRTVDGSVWRSVVHPLMDLVPVVVLDTRVPSPGVVHEVERVLAEPRRLAKTVFMTGPKGESPALDKASIPASPEALCKVDPEIMWHLLNHLFARPAVLRSKEPPLRQYASVLLDERAYGEQAEVLRRPRRRTAFVSATSRSPFTRSVASCHGPFGIVRCLRGVRVYLPKTDFVAVSDGQKEPVCVSWEDLVEVMGSRLAAVSDMAPPRWELSSGPTDAEWAGLRVRHVRLPK